MPKCFSELSNERKLVILCSRGFLSDEHKEQIKEILSKNINWSEIIYQCVFHRVLNIMYYNLKKLGLLEKLEKEVLKLFESQSKVYSLRNETHYLELKIIFDKFNEQGLRVAVLKGNYLAANVYPSIETRTFNDLDFLLDAKDADKVSAILESLGYKQGRYNKETEEIIPLSRKEKLFHQMNTTELPEFRKVTNNPFSKIIVIDCNLSVLWKGNCPCEISTSELLDRAIEFECQGTKVYILDKEDFLIQLACHLYKEATLLNWICNLKDLKLYKFNDILLYVEKFSEEINWDKLVKFCKKVGCEKLVYYAFYYVNLIYGQTIPENTMKALEPENLEFLDEYGVENEKPSKWNYDFFTRMFDTSRILDISEEALEKRNTFWENKDKVR